MLLIILISISAVAIMVLGLALTRIFKGRDIQGEVGTNPHMRRLGLECPAREGVCETGCGECEVECGRRG